MFDQIYSAGKGLLSMLMFKLYYNQDNYNYGNSRKWRDGWGWVTAHWITGDGKYPSITNNSIWKIN